MPAFSSHSQVTLSDERYCFDQGISGHHLKKSSVLFKVRSKSGEEGNRMKGRTGSMGPTFITCSCPQVVGSAGHCFQNTIDGPRMQVLNLGVLGPVLGRKGLGRVKTGLILCAPLESHPPTHSFHPFLFSERSAFTVIEIAPKLVCSFPYCSAGGSKVTVTWASFSNWHKGAM